MTINPKAIAAEFKENWRGTPVNETTILSIITDVLETKLRGYALDDYLTDTYHVSIGAALELKNLTRAARRAENRPSRSSEDARIDRILRTRDSTGRARARKFR